ncbi:hypothetical protein M3Y97_01020500 [Aphelenchoides bicaudatus]|nr:hypothetical protein M3Y97_01020500 [Aphelenchoides bicaudatus]
MGNQTTLDYVIGSTFCIFSLITIWLYMIFVVVIFKSQTIDKGPCFRLMMAVNLCSILQLVMQFYAGISSLIDRQSEWTWIEMLIVSLGNSTVIIQEFLNFLVALNRFLVLVLDINDSKFCTRLMLGSANLATLTLFLLITTTFMLTECRYFYDRYTWEIAVFSCTFLNAIQYLEYFLYGLMVLTLIFYVLIAGKLIMTRRLYISSQMKNAFGNVEKRLLVKAFGTFLTATVLLLLMHTLHPYLLGTVASRIAVQYWNAPAPDPHFVY